MADNKLYEVLGVSRNATDSEIKKVNFLHIVVNGKLSELCTELCDYMVIKMAICHRVSGAKKTTRVLKF